MSDVQPKNERTDWKGMYQNLQGRFDEISEYKKEAKLFNKTVIQIEKWHVGVALILAMVTIGQFFLLTKQNQLFKAQNEKIEIQSNLLEADRRNSLVFLLSNVLDAIDSELKEDVSQNGKRDLSLQLISRIGALSTSFKPYYVFEEGKLSMKKISPERTQLLMNLIDSNIDNYTLNKIYNISNFSYCDLSGISRTKVFLEGAILDHSKFDQSIFYISNFAKASLDSCSFENSFLISSDFQSAKISNSNLKNCGLINLNFTEASLINNRFDSSLLTGIVFKRATSLENGWDQVRLDEDHSKTWIYENLEGLCTAQDSQYYISSKMNFIEERKFNQFEGLHVDDSFWDEFSHANVNCDSLQRFLFLKKRTHKNFKDKTSHMLARK